MKHGMESKKAFTLIELLVVVLILAILMAVAMPLYLSAVSDSQKKTCGANMQTIANAVQAARVQSAANDYSALTSANVATDIAKFPDLKAAPVCPTGGTYSVVGLNANANYKINCSTHGDFTPGG